MTASLKHTAGHDPAAIRALVADGKLHEAAVLAEQWIADEPAAAPAWHLKGLILAARGDHAAAVPVLNHALKLKPDFAEACFDLARSLQVTGPAMLAVKMYDYLLKIAPDHAEGRAAFARMKEHVTRAAAAFEQGNALYGQGRMEQAEAAYRASLEALPMHPDALGNLGVVLAARWKLTEAHQVISEALRLNPQYFQAYNTLGGIYHSSNQYDKAVDAYRRALAIKPDHFASQMNLGHALWKAGDIAGAVESYERALVLEPDHIDLLAELAYLLYFLCRWDRVAEVQTRWLEALARGKQASGPFFTSLYAPPVLQLTNARLWSAVRFPNALPYDAKRPLPAEARGDGKLRIGYLSSDFGQHATAHLISELFEHHDHARFEIYGYSCGVDDKSAERTRIAKGFSHARDLGITDSAAAAQAIAADGIDILVDLKGYTQDNRMDIMAHRPAPIAMHYLGYPGTTGAPFIDYFLADAVSAPKGADALFSEALIRLPHSYQVNDRKRALPDGRNARKEHGLPEQGFVFCVFNNSYKITPLLFDAWMRLLGQVEGSVLWMWVSYDEAFANLEREAKERGIDPARIVRARSVPPQQHLARYACADLFLDTFPVCGHTTASDALWCGVPVVTLAGENFASRVAASLLEAVQLKELVTHHLADYEALALALARDSKRLAALRKHLVEGRMKFPLFDSVATTRAIEAAYEHAARRHRKGQAPAAFAIGEDFTIS